MARANRRSGKIVESLKIVEPGQLNFLSLLGKGFRGEKEIVE
jgi:hypothetical protein